MNARRSRAYMPVCRYSSNLLYQFLHILYGAFLSGQLAVQARQQAADARYGIIQQRCHTGARNAYLHQIAGMQFRFFYLRIKGNQMLGEIGISLVYLCCQRLPMFRRKAAAFGTAMKEQADFRLLQRGDMLFAAIGKRKCSSRAARRCR